MLSGRRRIPYEETEEYLECLDEQMRSTGLVEPIAYDSASELRLWKDHDLASFVENRLGLVRDPASVLAGEREQLIRRATLDGKLYLPARLKSAYWLVEEGERVGAIALNLWSPTLALADVSNLYVRPAFRRRGVARRALQAAWCAARAAQLPGIRLSTSWTWQPALRLYFSSNMWVRLWKDDIDLMRASYLPPFRVEVDEESAVFSVRSAGPQEVEGWLPILRARRAGNRLLWQVSGDLPRHVAARAPATFALALALRGWPLVRSSEAWQRQLERGAIHAEQPEALALSILRWEAAEKHRGWLVNTPRLPGLG